MRCKLFLLLVLLCNGLLQAQVEAFKEDTSRIEITRLDINSNRGDFSPFLSGNKLYFTSGRVHRYGLVYIDADTTKELEDVFYAVRNDSLHYKQAHYLSEKINTRYNDGPLCFNKTGDVIYITGNDPKRMVKGHEPLDIFMAKKEHDKWGHPVSLPFCTGTNTYCHPAIMPDGKTLIFSSDMPGGAGGMDLYVCKFENGVWSNPQNLGTSINTSDNEVFPFVTADHVLYFSSNRKAGIGGLDIYVFDLKDPINSEVTLLSSPFNSVKDDFGVWVDSLGNTGYFSSNRGKAGDDDIYYFKNKYPVFDNCVTLKQPSFCFTFFEESTLQTVDTLGMTYEWDLGDGTKMRGVKARHCFKEPGNYSIQLNIIDKASGALFYNEMSYDFTVEEPKQLFMDCPDTIALGSLVTLDAKRSSIKGFSLNEFYWFFGDEKFAIGKTAQHAYKKQGSYLIHLGVVAKNDTTGKMKKFCVQKNLFVKDDQWVSQHASSVTKTTWPPPRKVDSVYKTSQTEDLNFRVHLGSSKEDIPTDSKVFSGLKDVHKYKDQDAYTYTSGSVKSLSEAIPYFKVAKELGFKDAVVVSFSGDKINPGQTRTLKGEISTQKVVAVYVDTARVAYTNTIYFDFNQSNFSKTYNESLDSLCMKLKDNKNFSLVIFSISDTVGTDAYNYTLSMKRANNVKKFILGKGIKSKRMESFILGENVPLEYQRRNNSVISNRRVELLLVRNKK